MAKSVEKGRFPLNIELKTVVTQPNELILMGV
jgi:hypothetical protein